MLTAEIKNLKQILNLKRQHSNLTKRTDVEEVEVLQCRVRELEEALDTLKTLQLFATDVIGEYADALRIRNLASHYGLTDNETGFLTKKLTGEC